MATKNKVEIPKMDAYILGKDSVKVFLRTKVYTKREGEGGYIFITVPELMASVEGFMRTLQHREHHKLNIKPEQIHKSVPGVRNRAKKEEK